MTCLAGLMLGLVGSAHCAVMCGPLVALGAAHGPRRSRVAAAAGVALYQAGRLGVYLVLGVVMAAAGDLLARSGFSRALSASAGAGLLWSALVAWRLHRREVDLGVTSAIAGAIALGGLMGLVAPRVLALPYRGWMFVGHTMGRVTTPIVLTLVYLLVFTPGRFMLRLFGIDPLARKLEPDATTYWITRTKKLRAEDFERLT